MQGSGEYTRRFGGGGDVLCGVDVAADVHVAPLSEVEDTAVAAARLRFVERLVREEEQLGGGLDVEAGERGGAGREGERHALPLDLEVEILDALADAVGEPQRLRAVGAVE